MKQYKRLFYLIGFFLLLWGSERIYSRMGGPYPEIGIWELEVTETELIEIITQIKRENPSLKPPRGDFYYKSEKPVMLGFKFYYSDTKEVVDVVAEPTDKAGVITFQFISLSATDNGKYQKSVNGGIEYWDKWRQFQKFDKRIIEKIKQKIKKRRTEAPNTKQTVHQPADAQSYSRKAWRRLLLVRYVRLVFLKDREIGERSSVEIR